MIDIYHDPFEHPEMHHELPLDYMKYTGAPYLGALQSKLKVHTEDNRRHITEEERDTWNRKADKVSLYDLETRIAQKADKKEIRERAQTRFAELGLPKEVLDKHAVELSGGMKQRTVIAVSTILSPKVLIADEPSSALDVTSQKMVIKMMRELMEKGYIKSMLFISQT